MTATNATGPGAVGRANAPRLGIACMLAGSALLTLSDTFTKLMREGLPPGEVLFLRSVFILLPILVVAARSGGIDAIRVHDVRSHAIRAVCMVAATYSFVTGLGLLPLATSLAVTFAGPLFVTALAPFLLGETVGWRRTTAVLAGFLGVLVITRPTGAGFDWAVLFPLAAALFSAVRDITTRHMSATDSSLSILFVATVALTLGGLASAPFGWRAPTAGEVAILAAAGLIQALGHFLAIESFRWGEAALVIPFKYTSLVWATLYGYLVWRDVPSANVVGGALIILISSLYIFRREIAVSRRKRGGDGGGARAPRPRA